MNRCINPFGNYYFGYHLTQVWDGKNKETTETESIDINLGKLVIDYRWKSADGDDRPYKSFHMSWRRSRAGQGWLEIFSWRKEEGKNHFQSALKKHIQYFFRRLFHRYDIYKRMKEIKNLKDRCHSICSDPLCGCPEDFAYDYGRKIRKLEAQMYDKYYRY